MKSLLQEKFKFEGRQIVIFSYFFRAETLLIQFWNRDIKLSNDISDLDLFKLENCTFQRESYLFFL